MPAIDFMTLLSYLDLCTTEELETLTQHATGANDHERVISALNIIATRRKECPHCHSKEVKLWGKSVKLQRFRCSECGKTYTSLTKTPLSGLHRREMWVKMARAINECLSVKKTAERCGVSIATAFRWRHRFLARTSKAVSDKLQGIVEIDETYFLHSCKGQRGLGRPSRHRGGKARKRGLSSEQVPVLVAMDRRGNVVDVVMPNRRAQSVAEALSGKIAPSSVVCIDGADALLEAASRQGLQVKMIAPGRHVHAKEPIYHIQSVNGYHSRLKLWIKQFKGVATKYLQNYLGWRRMFELSDGGIPPLVWLQAAVRA